MTAPAEQNTAVNVGGTTHAVELARALEVERLHHVSSIAVAGDVQGQFRARTCSTRARSCPRPITARSSSPSGSCASSRTCPGACTGRGSWSGDSKTGEMDKIDGPYYFFKAIQRMRELVPEWMPLVGLDLGKTNVVPVDWVAGRARPHRARARPRRQGLPPDRPARAASRRAVQRVRGRRARPEGRGERRQTADGHRAEVAADAGAGAAAVAPGAEPDAARAGDPRRRCSSTWS